MSDSKIFWWLLIFLTAFLSLMTLLWLAGAGPVQVCGGTLTSGPIGGGHMQETRPLFEGCKTDWNWGMTIPSAIFFLASVAAFVGSIAGLRGATRRSQTAYLHAEID